MNICNKKTNPLDFTYNSGTILRNMGLKGLKHYNNHAQIFILLHNVKQLFPVRPITFEGIDFKSLQLELSRLKNFGSWKFFFRKTNFFSSSS